MQILKAKNKLVTLPVGSILPNPSQPRRIFLEAELQALAESIQENGLLQPVTVRKMDKQYVLVAGERRLRAAKLAGLETIPAIVTTLCQEESAVMAILENLQRQDLNMFEEANAIANLVREWDITQEQAAKKLGMSQSNLANKIRLLKLSSEEQEVILREQLTVRHARALLKIHDMTLRQRVLAVIVEKNLNVKQAEAFIEGFLEKKEDRNAPKRMFIAKDIRLFINTIDHAVDAMKTAGIEAESARRETDEYIECTVRIPKLKRVQV